MADNIRRIICCMLLATLLVLHVSAFAQDSCINEGTRVLSVGGANSYAWNERYVFIAEGFFKDNEFRITWAAPHYRIIRQDRFTQDQVILVEDYPYIGVWMCVEGESIYLLRSNVQDMNNIVDYWMSNRNQEPMPKIDPCATEYEFYIDKISFNGEKQKTMCFDIGEYICDFLIHDKTLYITTDSFLLNIDVCSGQIQKIYTAKSKIKNGRTSAHMIMEDGILYIRDGEKIIAVDTCTGEYDEICDFSFSYPMLLRFEHEYIVLNRRIYFWDETCREMVSIDLDSRERVCISKDRYFFNQVTDEGISVFRIRESDINKMYINVDHASRNQIIDNMDYSIVEECFYEFSNILIPEFDLLVDTLTPFEAWDRVFLGNGQYIDNGDSHIQQRD